MKWKSKIAYWVYCFSLTNVSYGICQLGNLLDWWQVSWFSTWALIVLGIALFGISIAIEETRK